MRTLLFFQREHARPPLKQLMFGVYKGCGLMLLEHADSAEMFRTEAGKTYNWLPRYDRDLTDFLLLPVDEEASQQVARTCRALCQAKVPFNLKDLLLLHVPFREVPDTPLFECATLHNVQAIILVLRECLPQDHALQTVLRGLHSRQTLAEDLYNGLLPLSQGVDCLQKFLNWTEHKNVQKFLRNTDAVH
jgi:hypothetical protein